MSTDVYIDIDPDDMEHGPVLRIGHIDALRRIDSINMLEFLRVLSCITKVGPYAMRLISSAFDKLHERIEDLAKEDEEYIRVLHGHTIDTLRDAATSVEIYKFFMTYGPKYVGKRWAIRVD